jgi:hypothetical protein
LLLMLVSVSAFAQTSSYSLNNLTSRWGAHSTGAAKGTGPTVKACRRLARKRTKTTVSASTKLSSAGAAHIDVERGRG